MSKTPWGSIDVHAGERVFVGRERLASLVRLLRNEAPAGVSFRDAVSGAAVTDATEVNWSQFPLQEAMDATQAYGGGRS